MYVSLNARAATANSSNVFPKPAKGIYVGGTGNVGITTTDNVAVLFASVPAGTIIPVTAKTICSNALANTTATNLVLLFDATKLS